MDIKKIKMKFMKREFLTESTILATFELEEVVNSKPGQFANILVAEKTWRSYSIVGHHEQNIKFLIDITPGGPGSQFIEKAELGSEVEVLIPMGGFLLNESNAPKIFVATGVGIAPFKLMIESAFQKQSAEEVILLWGVRYDKDYYIDTFLENLLKEPRFKVIPCITQTQGGIANAKKDRVTSVLPTLELDFPSYELYVCGNPNMVVEVIQIAKNLGISELHSEKY